MVADGRKCKPTLSFGWSRVTTPVELSIRYTIPDGTKAETASMCATVE